MVLARLHGCQGIINSFSFTPPKTNIEPENHPVEKENHLPNLHFLGSMLVFAGVLVFCQLPVPKEALITFNHSSREQRETLQELRVLASMLKRLGQHFFWRFHKIMEHHMNTVLRDLF